MIIICTFHGHFVSTCRHLIHINTTDVNMT